MAKECSQTEQKWKVRGSCCVVSITLPPTIAARASPEPKITPKLFRSLPFFSLRNPSVRRLVVERPWRWPEATPTTSMMTPIARPQVPAYAAAALSMKRRGNSNSYEHGRKSGRSRELSKSIFKDSQKRTRGRGSSAPHCIRFSSAMLMDQQTAQGHYSPPERDNPTPHLDP
jgi:hypothetical protein